MPGLSGLSSPIFVTHAGDGSQRLFIVEQGGIIKVLQAGSASPTVCLNISSKVVAGGERGLLGLAFHPDFGSNGRLFVDYTRKADGATVIAEYGVAPPGSNVAGTTETTLLTIAQPFANHNGGMLAFGVDGYLNIGMGDGGAGNDPDGRAQNLSELLGKILRIDVDTPNGAVPYSSPTTNPFFGVAGADEIFAYGFRNPWRFSFDRETHQLYVGDVGQNAIEEIDIVTVGGNYGWRIFEGTRCNTPTVTTTESSSMDTREAVVRSPGATCIEARSRACLPAAMSSPTFAQGRSSTTRTGVRRRLPGDRVRVGTEAHAECGLLRRHDGDGDHDDPVMVWTARTAEPKTSRAWTTAGAGEGTRRRSARRRRRSSARPPSTPRRQSP